MAFGAERFRDRREAGALLAQALERFRDSDPVILALPRGGVPVAFEVAKALGAPLDVLIVRKIGAPGHEEFGLGAVVDGSDPQVVLNDEAMRIVEPPPGYIEAQIGGSSRKSIGGANSISATGQPCQYAAAR